MAKKQKKPEEPAGESAPMWIVSFADLVTLMMSFFVVLYALKKGGDGAEASVTEALVSQFQGDFPMDPDNAASVLHYRKRGIDITKERGTSDDAAKGAEGRHPDVKTIIENAATPTSGGSILFDQGKSDLTDASREVIAKLIPVLEGHNAVLNVKGHVSGDEIAGRPDDPYGTALSQRRANAVAEELIRKGIDRRLLRPIACGPFEPTRSGSYERDDIANNRRVEVFSTNTLINTWHPTSTVDLDMKTEPPAKKSTSAPASAHDEEPESHEAPSAPAKSPAHH